jgi:hypothetical protein
LYHPPILGEIEAGRGQTVWAAVVLGHWISATEFRTLNIEGDEFHGELELPWSRSTRGRNTTLCARPGFLHRAPPPRLRSSLATSSFLSGTSFAKLT